MKYIENKLNANIVKLKDINNNYTSDNVEGALEEIDSKIKTIETNAYDDTQIKQDIVNIKTEIGTEELTTTDQTIKGAVNEIDSQIKEIMNNGTSGIVSNVEPYEDDIPKVFFYGDISNMSKSTSVDLDFEYRSRTASYKGVANTKWQGSSSLSYNKKNYTIKLFTDNTKSSKLKLNLKGWGNQNKFCLKANYVDSLHVRNLAGARIAYDMIKSRSDFDSLPTELQQAPRCGVVDGFPIKVYINGELIGLYTWNIPKDKWCSNMDEDNVNHAFLMAEKNNNGSSTDPLVLACEFRANATIFADTSTAQYPAYDWVVEGPGDDVSADIRTSFNNLINCVKDTDDATFKTTISNYLDLTSAFDYYCFAYLVCHYDGLGKNLGMATYDGTKWFCTLYDMDSIFGANINGSNFLETDRQCPEQYQETNSLLWQRIEECFSEELYARYLELRQGALSLGNIFTHVEEIYDIIPDRAYTEDRTIWTSLPSASTNTIARIRTYMINRASYVDSEMYSIANPETQETQVPCTGISLDQTSINLTGTQQLTATVTPSNTTDTIIWETSDSSVATVSNGLITAKGNGEATITATCGAQSATCNVTVNSFNVSNVYKVENNTQYSLITNPNKDINNSGEYCDKDGIRASDVYIEVISLNKYDFTCSSSSSSWFTIRAYDENFSYLGRLKCLNTNSYSDVIIPHDVKYVRFGFVDSDTTSEIYVNITNNGAYDASGTEVSMTTGYEINTTDGTEKVNNVCAISTEYIEVQPNTQYTILSAEGTYINVVDYDSNKTFLSKIALSEKKGTVTFTTQTNSRYIRFSIFRNDSVNTLCWIS